MAALALTREGRQNCVRFVYRGPQVDRLHVLELERNVGDFGLMYFGMADARQGIAAYYRCEASFLG